MNLIKLITLLHLEQYSINISYIGLFQILLSSQVLSTFVPFFEKNSSILHNFETFLVAFEEAFGEHVKIYFATTKIQSLYQ